MVVSSLRALRGPVQDSESSSEALPEESHWLRLLGGTLLEYALCRGLHERSHAGYDREDQFRGGVHLRIRARKGKVPPGGANDRGGGEWYVGIGNDLKARS